MPDPEDPHIAELTQSAANGNAEDFAQLFEMFRDRLRKMVDIRMSPDLRNRVDPSDVLQEAFVELANRLPEFQQRQERMPFFLWLRLVTIEKLQQVHREHINTLKRDARRDVSIHSTDPNDSIRLMAVELSKSLTSVEQRMLREEELKQVEDALMQMDELDREVIVLRIFEELSNAETASVLEVSTSTASRRFIQAIESLRKLVATFGINSD